MGRILGGGGSSSSLPGSMTEWPGKVNETFTVTVLSEPRMPDDEPRGGMVTSKWGVIGDPDPESTAALDEWMMGLAMRRRFGMKP